jgi:hypothetical protein
LHKLDDALGRFYALGGFSDQRHADSVGTGVDALGFSGKVTAGQNRHIVKS